MFVTIIHYFKTVYYVNTRSNGRKECNHRDCVVHPAFGRALSCCKAITSGDLRAGQTGIDTLGKRANVVAQRTVAAEGYDDYGREDKSIFGQRLAKGVASHGFTRADEHPRY